MTNKEAIEALKWKVEYAKEIGESYIDCVYVEALDLAIKALENQTTEGDCISRSALKEAIDKDAEDICGIEDVIDYIDNAPTVKFSLLPADESKDEAYMRGYEHGKIEGILKARPQGEWINKNPLNRYAECSECHYWNSISRYCPECGADMRKGGAE